MRFTLLMCLMLAGCRRECQLPPEPEPCVPEGWHCGEVRFLVNAAATTGASYAILADGVKVFIPYDRFDRVRIGDWYCGPIGIYAP